MAKYGVWNDVYGFAGYVVKYSCSNCGGDALDIQEYPFKSLYCPWCGAKMMNSELLKIERKDEVEE